MDNENLPDPTNCGYCEHGAVCEFYNTLLHQDYKEYFPTMEEETQLFEGIASACVHFFTEV